jgi:transcriptional regulator with XRE-family HTH domain
MSHTEQQDEPQSQRATTMDCHVGARIRERRLMMGLSQQQLARIIGVTYQQAHKYERGLNRISAGRLFAISQALDIKPAWFFEGLTAEVAVADILPRQRMHLELMRNFALIKSEKQQDAITIMARSLAVP